MRNLMTSFLFGQKSAEWCERFLRRLLPPDQQAELLNDWKEAREQIDEIEAGEEREKELKQFHRRVCRETCPAIRHGLIARTNIAVNGPSRYALMASLAYPMYCASLSSHPAIGVGMVVFLLSERLSETLFESFMTWVLAPHLGPVFDSFIKELATRAKERSAVLPRPLRFVPITFVFLMVLLLLPFVMASGLVIKAGNIVYPAEQHKMA